MSTAAPARSSQIRVLRRQSLHPTIDVVLRPIRPSLMDLRLTGDPWIGRATDEALSLQFDAWQMTAVRGSSLDLAMLNGLLDRLRSRAARRRR
jgi:hypothetical protein